MLGGGGGGAVLVFLVSLFFGLKNCFLDGQPKDTQSLTVVYSKCLQKIDKKEDSC